MNRPRTTLLTVWRRVVTTACVSAVVSSGLVVLTTSSATADPAPVASRSGTSVTADVLPTAQVNGVVWSQAVVGNTVYVGGSFTAARPAGKPTGDPTEVARGNLMSFDITTGALNTSFAPNLNAEVQAVAASPDGSRIYVGGSFTTANGVTHNRIAAFSTSDGSLISSFSPSLDASVNAIAVTSSAVYVGGQFAKSGSVSRSRLAAFDPSTGALLAWAPTADSTIDAMTMTPDNSRVIIGGAFAKVNGTSQIGMASVSATDGSLQPWAANSLLQDYGNQAAILSLTTDGTAIYGTGYKYGPTATGNFEGSFSADPSTGNLNWMEDCHGDTYSSFPMGGSVYVVGHAHYCGNVGGFPQLAGTFHRTMEFVNQATGTLKPNGEGTSSYTNYGGQPSPTLVNWFPDLAVGSYTGQNQAAWSLTGNSSYVVEGGEFPSVNGIAQQGLVRFAIPSVVTPKVGPTLTGANLVPTAQALSTTSLRLTWQADYDRDDQNLTYNLIRNGATGHPIYTTTATSQVWNRPGMSYVDSGLTPGATYQYRVFATDPNGNQSKGNTVNITVPTTDPGPYLHDVLNDGASNYWRLNESAGSSSADTAGSDYLTLGTAVTHSATGSLLGTANTSDTGDTFDGTVNSESVTSRPITAPATFTAEAWFKTTSTQGGQILNFGTDTVANTSSSYDRTIYLDNAGHVLGGVSNGGLFTAVSANTYNDGNWHQATLTLSSSGVTLYVDGLRVGRNSATTTAQSYTGYWHLGGDNLSGWPSAPTNKYFTGSIDEAAIYPSALNLTQVQTHYIDSGRTLNIPARPTDAYGTAVYNDGPDAYWRLDDTSGPTAADTTPNLSNGVYASGETFGSPTPVTGSNGTGVTFNGTSGSIGSVAKFVNPLVYSEEAWFNTTTTKGGQIVGFGNAQSGASTSYDRDVYMQTNGYLVFGVNSAGSYKKAITTKAFNDGKWHHIVATEGSDGTKLYVDGVVAASTTATGASNYTGYWRVGGNTNRGSSNPYFAGTIDEASLYLFELTPAQVTAHYQASPASVNQSPVASATGSCTNLTCSFDGTASRDPDGSVASYSWNFGDGSTGTGSTVSHTYAAAGTYSATLTVTDNRGATGTTTVSVTATSQPVNLAPTASFTKTCTYLSCSFNGSGSSDTDGTISSYAWDFGDGSTGTGQTISHTFSASGTYSVKLTVTDNGGAIGTSTQSISVVANQPPVASYTYTCSNLNCSFNGSGSTDSDGTVRGYSWSFGDGATETVPSPSHSFASAGTYTVTLSVMDDQGATGTTAKTITVAANAAPTAVIGVSCSYLACSFNGSGSSDSDGSVATYAWNFGDGSTSTAQSPAHSYTGAGSYNVTLSVTDNQGATGTASKTISVAPNAAPSAAYTYSCSGTACSFDGTSSTDSDGSIASYTWDFGDGSSSTSATPSHTYSALGSQNVTLTVTDNGGLTNSVTHQVTTSTAPNQPPTAAFTTTSITNLTATFDGTGSSDSDGTIASYAWSFGDGAVATGSTASRTYAGPGVFTVTLTVTDNSGSATSISKTITVNPATNYASDGFGRTQTSGWGTADSGGSWTPSSASLFSTDGSTGKVNLNATGASPTAYLGGVSQSNVSVMLDVSVPSIGTGTGTYVGVVARHVGKTDYRLKARFMPSGVLHLLLSKVVNASETSLKEVNITNVTYTAGSVMRMRFVLTGTAPTTLTGKIWPVGTAEPSAPQISLTDSESTLQSAGSVGVMGFLSSSATTVPVLLTVDNFSASATS